jgi:hypothetical protein
LKEKNLVRCSKTSDFEMKFFTFQSNESCKNMNVCPGLPDFSWFYIPKWEKYTKLTTNYTKLR